MPINHCLRVTTQYKGRVHLENLGKVMETSIKENPTHFFGDNGRLMSLKKLAKVNGHGIFDPPPTAFVNGLLLSFFQSETFI